VWEVKDPLLAGADSGLEYEGDTGSNYQGAPASLVGGVSGQQLYQQKGSYNAGGRGYPPPPSSERY